MKESYPYPVICIVAEKVNSEGGKEILLQKRTKKRQWVDYYGLWELPQGKIRSGEAISVAAARELKEETGLDLLEIQPSHEPQCRQVLKSTINAIQPLLCVLDLEHRYLGIGIVVTTSGTMHSTADASDHKWVTKAEIVELLEHKAVFPLNVAIIESYFSK